MIENILIGVFAVIILGGAVAAWWIENGPEKKDKNKGDKDYGLYISSNYSSFMLVFMCRDS